LVFCRILGKLWVRSDHWTWVSDGTCQITHRTDEDGTSGKIQARRIAENLQESPHQTAAGRVASNNNVLGIDCVVRRTRRRLHEVKPCCEAILDSTWEGILWCL
jgi:hypothetical protein